MNSLGGDMFDKLVIMWTQMIEEGGAEQVAKMFAAGLAIDIFLFFWVLLLTAGKNDR
jgi:hypothetical protein